MALSDLVKTELCDLLEALKLGQERALELMAATGAEVFGHSFDETGTICWQFTVEKTFGAKAIIKLYCPLTGKPTINKTVDIEWLKNECSLYVSEKEWLDAYEENVAPLIQEIKDRRSRR